jgi:hemerythrin superfamily protein
MNNQIHELLYHYNEEGHDLNEVQLLEKIDSERVEKLKLLLHNDDQYIAYQAMLILLAWSIPEGFELLDRFITEKWDEKTNFEPHRIYNEDNVYDVITNALDISTLNGKNEQELYPYIKQFLNIYGDNFFESNLKNFLLKKNCRPLLKEIEQAIESALKNKRYYQASQLFPVIVHYDKSTFHTYLDIFSDLISLDNRIAENIEEAKKSI